MRFVAPARADVPVECFDHPIFAGIAASRGWLLGEWPTVAEIDAQSAGLQHAFHGHPLRFRMQDEALLADGLHYETRIARQGVIATRADNWHDLFNAAIWRACSALKSAINTRQAADVERIGPRERTRGQYAMTHFDEAGAVVVVREPARLAAWDAHDWPAFFSGLDDGAYAIRIVGHALLEHALRPERLSVARCLVAIADEPTSALPDVLARYAVRIAQRHVLDDPLELRPLPLAGLPGWHPNAGDPAFLREAPCFRPIRDGRIYPSAEMAVMLKAEA